MKTEATKIKVENQEVIVIGSATTKTEAREVGFESETPTVAVCWFKGSPIKGFGHNFQDAVNSVCQIVAQN